MSKKLFIKTWGCQMNVYDSYKMADVLKPLGYEKVDTPDDADMVILNTCHIREKATDKVFSELGRLKEHQDEKKASGGKMIMAVAGCVAQAEGNFIMQRAPYVDMVFGPQTYHELPEMVLKATGERVVNTEFPAISKFDHLQGEESTQGVTAFLSIQEGCDKFCTFCVVPYTRGAEYSRPVEAIIEEARRLADNGAKEITLLGQNVNAYHGEDKYGKTRSLAFLMEEIAKIDHIQRIRYSTSHPRDMEDDLIEAHGNIEKVMPFLHLPVQSGSDKILKLMNRKHTGDHYREIIQKVRKARPDIALSSDFIIGFPGETEQDHEDTMQLVRDVTFASAYSFKYSPRPGTPASTMQNQLPEQIKTRRLSELQATIMDQQKSFNNSCIGKDLEVLFDRQGKFEGQYIGRSEYNQSVHLNLPEEAYGKIVKVRIETASSSSLSGQLLETVKTKKAA